jgi:16S rRNA (guanine(966)-N(2))-methyltransferase RsmD
LCGSFEGLTVLDLFAGTGSLGIEALSRGAASVLFIDNHRESAALINANLASTALSGRSEVMIADAESALSRLAGRNRRFDLVFADPPYGKGLAIAMVLQLASLGMLNDGAIVVIETNTQEELPATNGVLNQLDRRVYGDTALTFYSLGD